MTSPPTQSDLTLGPERSPLGRRALSPYVILAVLVFAALVLVGAIALSRQIADSSPAKPMALGDTGRYALYVSSRELDGEVRPLAGVDVTHVGDSIVKALSSADYGYVLSLPTAFESTDGVPYQVISVPSSAGYLISDSELEAGVLYTITGSAILDDLTGNTASADLKEITLNIPVISEFSASSVISKDRFEASFKVSNTIDATKAKMFTSNAPMNYAFVSAETFLPLLDRMFPSITSDPDAADVERDVLWQEEQGNLKAAGITRGVLAFFDSLADAEKASRSLIEDGFDPRF